MEREANTQLLLLNRFPVILQVQAATLYSKQCKPLTVCLKCAIWFLLKLLRDFPSFLPHTCNKAQIAALIDLSETKSGRQRLLVRERY